MSITRINSLGITDGTIVNGDINASAAIVSTKLSGVTIDIKAFVRFNGTTNFGGDCSIDSSRNVSSVTDNGSGDYTVNFTTAMSNTDYAAVCSAGTGGTSDAGRALVTANSNATGSCRVNSKNSNTGTLEDFSRINVVILNQ